MYLLACSREYVIVPARLLDARPLADPVDVAFTADDGTEPGEADWMSATWVTGLSGAVLGAGLLVGPGALAVPHGDHMVWFREWLSDGQVPVRSWGRLHVGMPL